LCLAIFDDLTERTTNIRYQIVQHLNQKSRVNEVDLLRFLAVIGVVFFHYAFRGYASEGMTTMPYPLAPIAKYGYFGVHLFFIISGFVIMLSASSGNLRNFIISRIVRLYPAFWICCTITFLFVLIMGAPRYTASFSQHDDDERLYGGKFNRWSLLVVIH
jgi:peptidoglycan/LPS O-acetylase OafA/YrhL